MVVAFGNYSKKERKKKKGRKEARKDKKVRKKEKKKKKEVSKSMMGTLEVLFGRQPGGGRGEPVWVLWGYKEILSVACDFSSSYLRPLFFLVSPPSPPHPQLVFHF